jgi:CRISPR-associated endonuclease Cas2
MYDFLVAYDIFDKKRLPKVKRIVYSYSLGGQKSALEVPLNKQLMQELIKNLNAIIEAKDRVNIIKIIGEPILLGRAKHIPYKKNGVIIL